MKIHLQNIQSSYEGFAALIHIAAQTKGLLYDELEVAMTDVSWVEANMCAPLGAVLYKAGRNLNTVRFSNVSQEVESILAKNAFLCNYGWTQREDTFGSTIEYKRFELKDERYFAHYIEKHMVGKGIPKMSAGLLKKFRESIYEIFSNAVLHSQTQMGIFSCGQYFHKKQRLDFSIADLGIGMRNNIKQIFGLDLSAGQAINWAVEGKNTTKSGAIPGGLGLKLLREFITQNEGRIQIVSDRGYWELSGGKITTKNFPAPFPGTVVNIEINTADIKSYCLLSEIRPEEIF